ncbi:ATP-binding protein [Acidovorax sp. Leaf73]|uniref:ATP-binding protein n=1 Tax=Acidovorax sp. Leaf73 TaxID=2876566 RepID=UPI001E57762C|nr:ATP-binding protein [Acidovorax sp. Leaf73]
MKRSEVFTPTTQPTVTYIGEHLTEKRRTLRRALEMGGAVVTLAGPSKSGKTVFVETVVGKDNLIQVTGASVSSADILWKRVFDKVGTPIPSTQAVANSQEQSQGGSIELGAPGCKVAGSLGGKAQAGSTVTSSIAPDYLNLIVREFSGTDFIIFIDDFHYIPKPIQDEIATLVKEAVRQGVMFVCASVPYHADDVILANPDLRGRMVKIDFDYWNPLTLKKIAEKGFEALNISVPDAIVEAFSREAAGSPQLMQSLCLNLCHELEIKQRSETKKQVPCDLAIIKKVCVMTSLMTDYTSVIDSMKDGPKTRGERRKTYNLRAGGEQLDVYPLLLRAIAADPPELTIRYANLNGRIERLCKHGESPSGSSVTGACAHMAEIANASGSASILEWDGESDVLDIRDPYLLFALRWSEVA